MSKYRKYFQQMLEEHKILMTNFKEIHDKYIQDEETWKKIFNEEGKKAVEIIRQYEKQLCSKTNSGTYSKFSSNLADKFWAEVRLYFPRIDFVGVK